MYITYMIKLTLHQERQKIIEHGSYVIDLLKARALVATVGMLLNAY